MNPSYEIRVWGNNDLATYGWYLSNWMTEMSKKELCAVADLMRYEILYREGGITLDADSICIRPLEDWLIETDEFACWENEHLVPNLIAVGTMGGKRESPFFGQIIKDLSEENVDSSKPAWVTTGPVRLTNAWKKYQFPLTIYPSHYFYPTHHSGKLDYNGNGIVFSRQLWGSTKSLYDYIHADIIS